MQSRNYVESSIVEIGEPGEHWNPSRHTVPLPTDAYGCIDFRGGSQTNKAQVKKGWRACAIHLPTPEAIFQAMLNNLVGS